MTYEQRRTTVVRETEPDPAIVADVDGRPAYRDPPRAEGGYGERIVDQRRVTTSRPTGSTLAARIVALVFGLIQLVIGLRIVFLLLNAREGNALVAMVLDWSRPLVAPFEGIFQTDALQSGGSVLDVAAVVALVGWTILELIILAIMRLPRSGEDVA